MCECVCACVGVLVVNEHYRSSDIYSFLYSQCNLPCLVINDLITLLPHPISSLYSHILSHQLSIGERASGQLTIARLRELLDDDVKTLDNTRTTTISSNDISDQELEMIMDRSNIFPSYQPSQGDDYMAGTRAPTSSSSSSSSSSSKQNQRSSPRTITSQSSSSKSPLKKSAKKSPPSKQSPQKNVPVKSENGAVGKKVFMEEAPPLIPLEGQVNDWMVFLV